MKKADLRAALPNFFLTAMLSISGTMALATAYDFTLNAWQVAEVCLLFAAAAHIAGTVPHGLWALPVLGLLSVRQLWESGLAGHTEAVLWYISTMLDKFHDTGYVIWWTGNDHLNRDTTAFFMLLGMLASILTGLGLSRHRTLPGIVMGALLLIPGMLIAELEPEPVWLLILLAVISCLSLTRLMHRTDPNHVQKLTLRATVCTVVLIGILTACFHPNRYTAPSFPAVENLLEQLEQLLPTESPLPTPPASGSGTFIPETVALDRIGAKTFSYRFAFEVTCSEDGWQYLRETSYSTYTGTSWLTGRESEAFSVDSAFLKAQHQSVQLDTHNALKTQYTPYYCPSLLLKDGKLPNTEELSVYTHSYQPLRDDWSALWRASYGSEPVPQEWDTASVYLELPDSTRENLQYILDDLGIDSSMNVLDIAQSIGSYVLTSAAYDLRTGRMPSSEEDFAIWFLESSETGYCIHFATAATVLLRAAGIPARYTTGYLVKTDAGSDRVVYAGNAHAWVEYYLPGFGWMILEVTPGSTDPLPTEPTTIVPTTEPTVTLPPEPTTEPPTLPDAPTIAPPGPTLPSEQPTTLPTSPGDSTGPSPPQIPDWVWRLLPILLWTLAAITLVIAQWRLRLIWLMKRLHRGDQNQQALSRWRHAVWLARLRKEAPPQRLLALANKAKFSQHTLTHGELRQFDLYRAETIDLLRKRNIFLRFVYRVILAIY